MRSKEYDIQSACSISGGYLFDLHYLVAARGSQDDVHGLPGYRKSFGERMTELFVCSAIDGWRCDGDDQFVASYT